MKALTAFVIVMVVVPTLATAQAPSAAAPVTGEPLPTPPPEYAYQPEGRRDPFVSLLNRGVEAGTTAPAGARPDGAAGIAVEEVVVRGILQSRGGWIAMIAAPTGRTYTIKPGDRLLDGNVRTINAQSVVLMQQVNDPLSVEKQREVRKFLRGEVK